MYIKMTSDFSEESGLVLKRGDILNASDEFANWACKNNMATKNFKLIDNMPANYKKAYKGGDLALKILIGLGLFVVGIGLVATVILPYVSEMQYEQWGS